MFKRTYMVALTAVLTVVMVLAFAGMAFAQWTDVSLSVVGPYGITEEQLGQISQGFVDGSWGPYNQMPRKQFVKMAVDAYKIPLVSPATPTFSDVPTTDYYYRYIEGANAAGMINGVGGGKFEPDTIVTREQAAKIIAVWVADQNGYDLATYYTNAEAAAIIADAFPDAAQVGPSIVKEVAFAIDFGIIWGTNTGTLAPKGTLIRIQGAAMLIRSWSILPFVPPTTPPAKIELVGADKAENLIGIAHTATFKVTDAAGAPVANALVDFDTLMAAYYYVGNISPSAGLTDADGLVKCVLISAEPGTERVSATVGTPAGLKTVYTTKYWLVLDEVYIVDPTQTAQNNVNVEHAWSARVVVFGPGPLSTSQQDWYNAISTTAVPGVAMEDDGIDVGGGWDYAKELWLAKIIPSEGKLISYKPRTMAGIDVKWSIYNVADDPFTKMTDESVTSVGNIISVDGTAITPARTATGHTNADGLSSIKIKSSVTGVTLVKAIADYVGNPYPEKLFAHDTYSEPEHYLDWEDQPDAAQLARKTWIPHTEGGPGDTKISPAYSDPNIGEELLLTLTLKDEFGNAITGKQVEWYMQGVGQFKSDDDQTMSQDGFPFGQDKDIDVTDANGTCRVLVKSLDPGEQIVHAKFRDKGINNQEGLWKEYVAEVQWFKVAIASFDKPATVGAWGPEYVDADPVWDDQNEAVSTNEVGTDHKFDFWVYGLKLEYFSTLYAGQGALTQTPWIDTDAAGKSYDGVMDSDDAKYLDPNGILVVNLAQEYVDADGDTITAGEDNWAFYDVKTGEINIGSDDELNADWVYAYDKQTGIRLGAGGITEFDFNGDDSKETAAEMNLVTGIYLPLQNKGVTFYMWTDSSVRPSDWPKPWNVNWATPKSVVGSSIKEVGVGGKLTYAGVDFTYDAITDATGHAFATVTSPNKGFQFVDGIVDYPQNPAKGNQRVAGRSWKTWSTQADPAATVKVTVDGIQVAPGEAEGPNPIISANGALDFAHITVHVLDAFGNELPDYEVVYEVVGNGQWIDGTQGAADTYHPWQYLTDNTPNGEQKAAASLSSRYPSTDPVTNSAVNQRYEKLTSIGTSHSGSFSATTGATDAWSWEFTASGLFRLPVTADGQEVTTYSLWLDNGAGLEWLADFNTNADGVIVGGKIFGSAAPDQITASTLVWVTGESTQPQAFVLGGKVSITGVADGNGYLPDNSEPRDDPTVDSFGNKTYMGYQDGVGPADNSPDAYWADPLAKIVGKGGTEAYYFWRADPKPPEQGDGNPYWGDGAKAWTLNGIDPTLPHGSALDVQLWENPYQVHYYDDDARGPAGELDDVRCIINLQIFKPHNGPVLDGTPWRVFEVQKVWAPTARPGFTVDITPREADNAVGDTHTVEAVLPAGAQPEVLFFKWYVNGEVVDSGWDMTSYSYSSDIVGSTDEIYYEVYAAEWADAIATSPIALKHWHPTLIIEQDTDTNLVGMDHTVRALFGGTPDVEDPSIYAIIWSVNGEVRETLPFGQDFVYTSLEPGVDTITAELATAETGLGLGIFSNELTKTWIPANLSITLVQAETTVAPEILEGYGPWTTDPVTNTAGQMHALEATLTADGFVDWSAFMVKFTAMPNLIGGEPVVWFVPAADVVDTEYTRAFAVIDQITAEIVAADETSLSPVVVSNNVAKTWILPSIAIYQLDDQGLPTTEPVTNKVDDPHTVYAQASAALYADWGLYEVMWTVEGPNAQTGFSSLDPITGVSEWTYSSAGVLDTDMITAQLVLAGTDIVVGELSNTLEKMWVQGAPAAFYDWSWAREALVQTWHFDTTWDEQVVLIADDSSIDFRLHIVDQFGNPVDDSQGDTLMISYQIMAPVEAGAVEFTMHYEGDGYWWGRSTTTALPSSVTSMFNPDVFDPGQNVSVKAWDVNTGLTADAFEFHMVGDASDRMLTISQDATTTQIINPVGADHTVKATITPEPLEPQNYMVIWYVNGVVSDTLPYGQDFVYTSLVSGTDTITARLADANGVQLDGDLFLSNELSKRWVDLTLALTPPDATNPAVAVPNGGVNPTHTVTATVLDAGAPVAGAEVTFTWTPVSGSVVTHSDTATTDASGVATSTWDGPGVPSVYSITASATFGKATVNETAPATKNWVARVPDKIMLWQGVFPSVDLAPSLNPTGVDHSTYVGVTDQFGDPVAGASVSVSWNNLAGATGFTSTGLTDAFGRFTSTWNGTLSGAPAPSAGVYQIEGAVVIGPLPSDVLTSNEVRKEWQDRKAATISLTQDVPHLLDPTATADQTTAPVFNPVGSDHTVTATAIDQFGDPLTNATVTFTWTGVGTHDVTTNAAGVFVDHASSGSPLTSTITASSPGVTGTITSNEVVKTWYTPVLTTIELQQALPAPVPLVWTADPLVWLLNPNAPPDLWMRGRALDQNGNPMFANDPALAVGGNSFKLIARDYFGVWAAIVYPAAPGTVATDAVGWFTAPWLGMPPQQVLFQAWMDADSNNVPTPGEVTSIELSTTFHN